MLNGLIQRMTPDLQLNQFRVQDKPRQMRTIFQWGFVPSEALVYIRPIETKFELNVDREMIQAKVLDNEPVREIYGKKIKQFTPIKVDDNGNIIKTVKEEMKSFKKFIRV